MDNQNFDNEMVNSHNILSLTSNIVSAHVSNNTVSVNDLPLLIERVYRTLLSVDTSGGVSNFLGKNMSLSSFGGGGLHEVGGGIHLNSPAVPFVPISNSVTPDYIVCLEDGKRLKMLKRHLKTMYNLTPEEYRERWGLSTDYPMVAPNYAKRRSNLAKSIGLGTRKGAQVESFVDSMSSSS